MTAPILVTGGTGTLGRIAVPRLIGKGARVRVLTRQPREARDGVDYVTGDLLEGDIVAAVDGAETVLHLAGDATTDEQTTTTVVRAAQRSGIRHLVFISVIAADRVPLGDFRAKYAAEQVVAHGGVPWTTLRAAQFHDFVLTVAHSLARSLVMPLPGMRLQPVEVSEVADRLVDLALGGPAGAVRDFAGPEVHEMRDMLHEYLRASDKHRLTLPVRLPGEAGRAYRNDQNLNLDADRGTRTWADYLAEKFPAAQR